ncbi:hypothetical protein OSB04_006776, partial [Centaurea solstitialis]
MLKNLHNFPCNGLLSVLMAFQLPCPPKYELLQFFQPLGHILQPSMFFDLFNPIILNLLHHPLQHILHPIQRSQCIRQAEYKLDSRPTVTKEKDIPKTFLLTSMEFHSHWLHIHKIGVMRMANTRSTRRSGSGASGAVAAGLGPRDGVGNRTTRRSRIGSSHSTQVESDDPSEESEAYTPRTPTREDLQDTIDNLKGENAELRSELFRVQSENDEVREEKNKMEQENDDLYELVHNLVWKCKVIEWDRRMIARSLKRRLGDRPLYYRGVALEFVGLIKGYVSSWAHLYRNGPNVVGKIIMKGRVTYVRDGDLFRMSSCELFLQDETGCIIKLRVYDTDETRIVKIARAAGTKAILFASRVKLIHLKSMNILHSTALTKIAVDPDMPEAHIIRLMMDLLERMCSFCVVLVVLSRMRIINEEGDNGVVTQDDAQQKSRRLANIDVSQGKKENNTIETTMHDEKRLRKGNTLDNRWVVPYNPKLLMMFNCHINVEACSSITSVKYLFKYIYKGHDKQVMHIDPDEGQGVINEIKRFQDARYVSPPEAMWRIFSFPLSQIHPYMMALQIHLPNKQMVRFREDDIMADIVARERGKRTMLTAFFDKNKEDESARRHLYKDFPKHYTWNASSRRWNPRIQGSMVGRLVYANPSEGERYYLRLLLSHISGPTSFEDLYTVNGILHPTFRKAALERGLIETDDNLSQCLAEASLRLFATILIYCETGDVRKLWDEHYESLSEDYRRQCESVDRVRNMVLIDIPTFLQSMAHSRFKIPLNLDNNSMCNIKKQSGTAQLLRDAKVIIWDEASMAKRQAVEALDRTMQDITGVKLPFGGKIMVMGGDFRQVLPVVRRGTRAQIVDSSLRMSPLWSSIKKIWLTLNMRARTDPWFADFLLRVGDGVEEATEESFIRIPDDIAIAYTDKDKSKNDLIDAIFPSLEINGADTDYIISRAILSTKNENVDEINDQLIDRFCGDEKVYFSFDEAEDDRNNFYPMEFLNALTVSGLPPHYLRLKIGCPIILLRNIDPSNGLCNGTRLICRRFQQNVIEAEIAVGQHAGKRVFLPRIPLCPSEDNMFPFKLKRKQFPIRLSFSMTINKAQGQTIPNVGVCLPKSVFSHGQLYVALSRGTSRENTKVLVKPAKKFNSAGVYTSN